MDKKKKGLVLTLVAILSLIAITVGVTYAFFNYVKEGTTENTITSGTITFLYTETTEVGRGIKLENAYPITDKQGKNLTGEGNVFDFKVTSSNDMNANIPYEVTIRKTSDSTLDEKAVRIYLTTVDGTEEEVLLDNFNNLTQTERVDEEKYIEKTIYNGKVPANIDDYEQAFRLRMWVDEDTDFSPVKDDEGNITYPYNNKTFTITVNVYANAKVVTDEEIANESKAEISSISVGDTEVTKVENENYDYETSLPEGTTETTIDIETDSPNATVKVEKLDSLAYSSNIKRLSTKKTLELTPGDNYFKITVTSVNKEIENEFTLKISVKQGEVLLSDAIFNKYTTIYENPTLDKTSEETNENGLYKSIATNSENPTYYFRGNIDNNWVDFAGFTWRVVRINEDGTIRLIMQDGINNNTTYKYNSSHNQLKYVYYSNSDITKPTLESWYNTNVASNDNYSSKVVMGDYYCEQAKVAHSSTHASRTDSNMGIYTNYTPNFKCETDANGYGIISSNVGLITYDELVFAGGYGYNYNQNYYLNNDYSFWTMSTMGFSGGSRASIWLGQSKNSDGESSVTTATNIVRPVINLKADTTVMGLGTSDSHWIVQ